MRRKSERSLIRIRLLPWQRSRPDAIRRNNPASSIFYCGKYVMTFIALTSAPERARRNGVKKHRQLDADPRRNRGHTLARRDKNRILKISICRKYLIRFQIALIYTL